MALSDQQIIDRWKDIHYPGSFSNAGYFYKGLQSQGEAGKKKLEDVRKLLEKDLAYQTTRVLPKTFARRTDRTSYFFSDKWEGDLGDIGPGRFNDLKTGKQKGRYFLLLIDVFSKKVWARGLKDKSGPVVLEAFKNILSGLQDPYKPPAWLETDAGKEFAFGGLKTFLSEQDVRLTIARGQHKARSAERAIRSFKKVLIPFLESRPDLSWDTAVQKVAESLNSRYQRTIDMAPDQVPSKWPQVQRDTLKASPVPSFLNYLETQRRLEKRGFVREGGRTYKVGDKVFLPLPRQALDKESDRQYGYQVYRIKAIKTDKKPYLYQLEDEKGKPVKRRYYAREMRKVAKEPELKPISQILEEKKVRGRRYILVQWMDHDARFNEWVLASQVQ